jgi:hypothetical protein
MSSLPGGTGGGLGRWVDGAGTGIGGRWEGWRGHSYAAHNPATAAAAAGVVTRLLPSPW